MMVPMLPALYIPADKADFLDVRVIHVEVCDGTLSRIFVLFWGTRAVDPRKETQARNACYPLFVVVA